MRFSRRWPLLLTLAAWYLRAVYRFRDPLRSPAGAPEEAVLSPADGVVAFILPIEAGRAGGLELAELLGTSQQGGWLLGIVNGPLDMHFSYAPVNGKVLSAGQKAASGAGLSALQVARLWSGQSLPPSDLARISHAERYALTIQTGKGEPLSLGFAALLGGLRATGYLGEGEEVRHWDKAAFLAEGGLVLLTLPESVTPQVGVGQRVRGAETVVAR